MLFAIMYMTEIRDYLANQTERCINLIRQDIDIMRDDQVVNFDELRNSTEELREDRVAQGQQESEQQQIQRDIPEPGRALTKNGIIDFIQERLDGTHNEAVQAYRRIDRVCLQACREFRTRNNSEDAYLAWRWISAADKQNLLLTATAQDLQDRRCMEQQYVAM